ncbi:type II toxin-antitoxin system RelE/ParE family toxin [Pseudomonas sp. OIL-1]|uniref:type II toxin-antitoxin system RelE/ParE family toxin n=1 Tax=Pseudomonas sp. OIL-1 TaxID=2706126 RepID=UPI0013A767EC|nr:hypothetical protein G3M63_18210 [Pseudomonas sp. OIL-1]
MHLTPIFPLTLLGYSYEEGAVVLYLLALGALENFYRDVKEVVNAGSCASGLFSSGPDVHIYS